MKIFPTATILRNWAIAVALLLIGIAAGCTLAASEQFVHDMPTSPLAVPVDRIHVHTLADVKRLRAQATLEIFGGPLPSGFPASAIPVFLPEAAAVQFPGDGYLLTASKPNGSLAIYHAGHSQLALREGLPTVRAMLGAGYDVLALSMPPEPHARFAGSAHPLRPFLAPVAEALNYALARKHYREVIMAGLSGGGWTTVVYSAIDPRISRSYPIAGSLPFYIRERQRDAVGDFEQQLPGLSVDYLDLYLMAASGGRKQVQVFNLHDPCCFSGSAALGYRDEIAQRATDMGGWFDVAIVANSRHELPRSIGLLMF